ncbi:hypothetical protein BJ165DRAFT_1531035 [Panaeolus papilionaceus]|nr:hypothetical protein BJ165DRAFT_1531035 [Panaeolus papilionaceus]
MAPRRSTRVKTQAVSNVVEAGPVVASGSMEKAYEESDEEFEENQYNKKKRKAAQPKQSAKKRASSQPPPPKKARTRGTKGVLKQIMEMPFDILYEIFTRLPPADLLSIGRTSRDLKDLVLGQDFKAIWSKSFSATGIPPCPEDMSQPAYAELAFGDTCWTCGSKKHVEQFWLLRLKLCSACKNSPEFLLGFSSHKEQLLPAGQLPKDLLTDYLLPGIYWTIGGTRWSKKYTLALYEEYSALSTDEGKAEWVKATVERISAARTHADKCQIWRRVYLRDIQKEEERDFVQRKARVVEMAKEMGWEEEMSKMSWKLVNRDEILRVCGKPFNDREFSHRKCQSNNVRADRVNHENKQKLLYRMKTLSQAYDEALALHYPLTERRPLASDIFLVPRIEKLVSDIDSKPDLTVADFMFTKKNLKSVIKDAYDIINAKILKVISNGLGKRGYDPTTILNLATTLFTNNDLTFKKMSAEDKKLARERSFLTVPEVLVCSSTRDTSRRRTSNLELYACEAFGYQGAWQAPSGLKFHKTAHDVAGQLLKICKLDPTTTTLDEIEELQPILECYGCNSTNVGRQVLTWDSAISHIIDSPWHAGQVDPQKITLLDGPDAERARAAIKEKKRRVSYSSKGAETVCLHCDRIEGLENMLDHVHKKHGVMFAGEEDFAFTYVTKRQFPDIGRPNGEYRLWPPRPPAMNPTI